MLQQPPIPQGRVSGSGLAPGHFYIRCENTPLSGLHTWSWVMGTGIVGVPVVYDAHPRNTLISVGMTLGKLKNTEPYDEFTHVRNLPPTAYHHLIEDGTPFGFMEAWSRGVCLPIERVQAQQIAEQLNDYSGPLAVLFSHSWMPLVDTYSIGSALLWANWITKVSYDPTPMKYAWGMHSGRYAGGDHWLIPILREMHTRSRGEQVHLTHIMKDRELAENILFAPQIFGASWINRCFYVPHGKESSVEISWIERTGIELVRA